MKKIILVALLFIPLVTNANTCDNVKDTQTSLERNLVCDAEKRTITSFKTNTEEVVLKNSVCEIKCSEEMVFSIDPIKKVLAGTSFNYPLYASGERKCTAVYDYVTYENKIKALVNEYENLTGTQKTTKGNEITNYYEQKKKCDEFTKDGSAFQNKYKYNGDVDLIVENSTNEKTIPYSFVEMSEYVSNVIVDEVNYASCKFNESSKTCSVSNTTINGWTEIARVYGKYTMKDVFLEKYTGDIKNTYSSNACNTGDRYFVDFTEITRPIKDDITDKGYKLTLIAKNLGNNLTNNNTIWNLNVDCWYQVKNMIFPTKKSETNIDENYEEYGSTAFQYRIIDLNNPFPERVAGANWQGKENIIYSTKDKITTLQKFVITLNRSSINKIREYNDVHSYDTFNLNEMERSSFIEANEDIIYRR